MTAEAGDTFGQLLRESPVGLLILNGKSVVEHFQDIARVELEQRPVREWTLPRRTRPDVIGIAYNGVVCDVAGVNLNRQVVVVGFNHNLQSSFGVTTGVRTAIRRWIARVGREVVE